MPRDSGHALTTSDLGNRAGSSRLRTADGGFLFLTGLFQLLHLFFAFSFVGSLVVAEWNGRAGRLTQDWGQKALLFGIAHLANRVAGLGGLVLSGVFGNLSAMRHGYTMGNDTWLRWVNGLWLLAVIVMITMVLPNAARLASIAQAAARGEPADGFERTLTRWRFGNVLESVLYLALLALMVFAWRA